MFQVARLRFVPRFSLVTSCQLRLVKWALPPLLRRGRSPDRKWTWYGAGPCTGPPSCSPTHKLGPGGLLHPPTDDLVERDTLRRLPAGLPAVGRSVRKQADSATVRDRPWLGSADLRKYC